MRRVDGGRIRHNVSDPLWFVFNSKVLCQTFKMLLTFVTHINEARNNPFHETTGPGNTTDSWPDARSSRGQ